LVMVFEKVRRIFELLGDGSMRTIQTTSFKRWRS
jgi:hypothetical protein